MTEEKCAPDAGPTEFQIVCDSFTTRVVNGKHVLVVRGTSMADIKPLDPEARPTIECDKELDLWARNRITGDVAIKPKTQKAYLSALAWLVSKGLVRRCYEGGPSLQAVFEELDGTGLGPSTRRKYLAVIARLAPKKDCPVISGLTRACGNEIHTADARREVRPIEQAVRVRDGLVGRCEELEAAGLPRGWEGDRIAAAVCHLIAHNGCMRPSEWGVLAIWNGVTGTPISENHVDLDRRVMVVREHKTSGRFGTREAPIAAETIHRLVPGDGRMVLGGVNTISDTRKINKRIAELTGGHTAMPLRSIMTSYSLQTHDAAARERFCKVLGNSPAVQRCSYQLHRSICQPPPPGDGDAAATAQEV